MLIYEHYLVAWHYFVWVAFAHAAGMANLRSYHTICRLPRLEYDIS
jgi:hypothetical protein